MGLGASLSRQGAVSLEGGEERGEGWEVVAGVPRGGRVVRAAVATEGGVVRGGGSRAGACY
eukprot:1586877-Prymnesium_polylepis.2